MTAVGDDGESERKNAPDFCPYQGLAPFETERTELFFGRARATRNLLERLGSRLERDGSLLLVSGASGVGKSSLLRAGLLPALAKGMLPVDGSRHWPRLLVTPTAEPLRALADCWTRAHGGNAETVCAKLRHEPERALVPVGRFVLVVDQFEELFTLVTDERERQTYVRALHALTGGPCHAAVVVGVRADYWDRCAAYPRFAEAIQDGQVIVEPMSEPDLRLAITGPAAAAGLEIEPGLVETVLDELRAERPHGDPYDAGALPLLSQALLNTWERRENGRLTLRGYEESGRVRDAVRRTADEVLDRLPPRDRTTALRLFRRMTLITPGGRVARRPVTWADVHAAASAHAPEERRRAAALLSAFADQRLLTLHEDTVEIAHDVLLVAWPTLARWLEPDLTAQAVYDRLVEDAAQWAEHHRDPAYLYRGARLLAVQDSRPRWDRDPDSFPPPGPTVDGFVAASTRAARTAGRRRGAVVAGLAVLAALALVAAVVAVDAADDAERQRRLAVSRQLAAQSEVVDDPAVAALLAVAAWRIAPTPQARHRMLDAASRPGRTVLPGAARPGRDVEAEFSPDGSVLATGVNGAVQLWDAASHRRLGALTARSGTVLSSCDAGFDLTFSPDGRTLATVCQWNVQFWDVSTRRPSGTPLDVQGSVRGVETVETIAFSPDGTALATSSHDGTTQLWDVAARRRIGAPLRGPGKARDGASARPVAFTRDGKHLVIAGAGNTVRLWDTTTRRQVGKPFAGHTDGIRDVSVSPDGTTLATSSADGTVRLWNLTTHAQIGEPLRNPADGSEFHGTAFSPDGTRLATAGADGSTRLWDVTGHRPVGTALTEGPQPVRRVAFSPDGRTLAAADDNGTVRLLDPATHRQVGAAIPALSDVRFSPDGRTLAASGRGTVRLWDVAASRREGRPLRPDGAAPGRVPAVYAVRFSPDGGTVATASLGGTVRLWSTATGRPTGPPVYSGGERWQVELAPNARLLAVLHGRSVGFWDVAARREAGPRISLPGRTDRVSTAAFSPDGKTLATAGGDRSVRLFDVGARRQIGRPLSAAVDGGFLDDVEFSPDGKTLATTSGMTVLLWDVQRQRRTGTALAGHTGLVDTVAFSPDGRTLVTGSADRTVRLWDLATRRQIGPPLTGHTDRVTRVTYSPTGTAVAGVALDGTARIWKVETIDPASTICAGVGRSLTRAEWQRFVPGEKYVNVCE
ncbi:WD40 repeat domain-containing protein [Actinomadura pelletieri]|nr:WD40 repeat domain-containing protein [Actinomadura pelletieri]